MCSVTVAATGVVYQSDTPLIWRHANVMSWKLGCFGVVFFFWQITLVFAAQIKTGRKKIQHALKAFQADMKVGLRRPVLLS